MSQVFSAMMLAEVPKNPLLTGNKKIRLGSFSIFEESKSSQAMMWVDEPTKSVFTGIVMLDESGGLLGAFIYTRKLIDTSTGEELSDNAMPRMFRLFNLFELLPRINPGLAKSAIDVALEEGLTFDSARFKELHAPLADYVSAEDLQTLLTSHLPPQFGDICVETVRQGAKLNLGALTDEIDLGRLEYDGKMHVLGVEKGEDRRRRLEKRDVFVAGFRPVIEAFRDFSTIGRLLAHETFLRSKLLQVRARGLDSSSEITFGLAVIALANDIAKIDDSFARSFFARDSLIKDIDGGKILNMAASDVARFVSKHYKTDTPQIMGRKLAELWRTWDMIPVDEMLL